MKQLPETLNNLELKLSNNGIGKNIKEIEFLSDGISQLPRNLQYFSLGLFGNELSRKTDNLKKRLGEIQIKLPSSLKHLEL